MSTIKFKNPETGLWEKVGIPTSGGGVSTVHIGSEPPTDANANMWYDTDDQQGSFYTAEQVDELLSGKVSMELLWENASPTSAFAAQTISIPELANSTDGDQILIETESGTFIGRCVSGTWLYVSGVTHENNAITAHERRFTIRTNTIEVGAGKQFTNSSYINNNYNIHIPIRIWRLRTEVQA